MTVAEQIRTAADLIERDGHAQNTPYGNNGERCMAQSLADAGGHFERIGFGDRMEHPAQRYVNKILGGATIGVGAICDYNNTHTAEECIAKLREIADVAERELVPA